MTGEGRPAGTRLPDNATVFRGIRSSSWINRDTGQVQAVAFLRRTNEDALSVSESRQNAVSALRKHYGIARLAVQAVRSVRTEGNSLLSLDVVADPVLEPPPGDPWHALITGLPPWAPPGTEDAQLQQDAADALLAIAAPEWVAPLP
jgi:hypothetical protein